MTIEREELNMWDQDELAQESDPIKILDDMTEIVKNDMLVRGQYVSNKIVDHDLYNSGAICRGRQACAVGSMWLAAGVPVNINWYEEAELPGASIGRADFLDEEQNSGLRAAYNAMNIVSQCYVNAHNIDLKMSLLTGNDPMEQLFEHGDQPLGCGQELLNNMLMLIEQAKDLIREGEIS
jgi:hypothetical protein